MELLHVVSFTLSHGQVIGEALSHLRRLSARSEQLRCPILLFCDLPDASCPKAPEEDPLIRKLLSGVMAMNARRNDSFFLLVRSRVWDDAQRQYLGAGQALSCREVIAQLLLEGKTCAAFEAASISPPSMKNRWQAVLFSDSSLACTPDTPMRMAQYMKSRSLDTVGVPVLPRREFPRSALARLFICSHFSLSPLQAAQEYAFAQQGLVASEQPILYTCGALARIGEIQAVPAAPGCAFIRRQPPDMRAVTAMYHRLRHPFRDALVPLVQLALLTAAAVFGFAPFAAAAMLPEIWTLLHPRAWPGALLRTAMLPMTAMLALDALLCRLLARSPLLRIRVPGSLRSPLSCLLAAGALLPAALISAQSLAVLLPILLLWLSAPLWFPALERPTIERIPLDAIEQSQMRTLAESAYFDAEKHLSASPALGMLCACAGCMLGLLEPDEAARKVQSLLPLLSADAAPYDQAAALVSAQLLRERMSGCDAALRPLPIQLESQILSVSSASSDTCLGRLLCAARAEKTPDFSALSAAPIQEQLFLPLLPSAEAVQHPISLPLTHPHTYLKQQLLSSGSASWMESPIECFLFLAASALGHPFHALLLRSPVTGPYAETLFSGISSTNP